MYQATGRWTPLRPPLMELPVHTGLEDCWATSSSSPIISWQCPVKVCQGVVVSKEQGVALAVGLHQGRRGSCWNPT